MNFLKKLWNFLFGSKEEPVVLEETPADLAGDIVENGIVLTGGGALLRGLDKYLSELVSLPVYIAEEPLLAVAKGTGKALEQID